MLPACSEVVWVLPQQEVAVGLGHESSNRHLHPSPTSRTQDLLSCWLWRVKGGSQP